MADPWGLKAIQSAVAGITGLSAPTTSGPTSVDQLVNDALNPGTDTSTPGKWTGQGPQGYGTYYLDGPGGAPGTFIGDPSKPPTGGSGPAAPNTNTAAAWSNVTDPSTGDIYSRNELTGEMVLVFRGSQQADPTTPNLQYKTLPNGTPFNYNPQTGVATYLDGTPVPQSAFTQQSGNNYGSNSGYSGPSSISFGPDLSDISSLLNMANRSGSTGDPRYQFISTAGGGDVVFDPITGKVIDRTGGVGSYQLLGSPSQGIYRVNPTTGDLEMLAPPQTDPLQAAQLADLQRRTGLEAATTLDTLLRSPIPYEDALAFMAQGGGNIGNAIASGASGLTDENLAPAAQAYDILNGVPQGNGSYSVDTSGGGGSTSPPPSEPPPATGDNGFDELGGVRGPTGPQFEQNTILKLLELPPGVANRALKDLARGRLTNADIRAMFNDPRNQASMRTTADAKAALEAMYKTGGDGLGAGMATAGLKTPGQRESVSPGSLPPPTKALNDAFNEAVRSGALTQEDLVALSSMSAENLAQAQADLRNGDIGLNGFNFWATEFAKIGGEGQLGNLASQYLDANAKGMDGWEIPPPQIDSPTANGVPAYATESKNRSVQRQTGVPAYAQPPVTADQGEPLTMIPAPQFNAPPPPTAAQNWVTKAGTSAGKAVANLPPPSGPIPVGAEFSTPTSVPLSYGDIPAALQPSLTAQLGDIPKYNSGGIAPVGRMFMAGEGPSGTGQHREMIVDLPDPGGVMILNPEQTRQMEQLPVPRFNSGGIFGPPPSSGSLGTVRDLRENAFVPEGFNTQQADFFKRYPSFQNAAIEGYQARGYGTGQDVLAELRKFALSGYGRGQLAIGR